MVLGKDDKMEKGGMAEDDTFDLPGQEGSEKFRIGTGRKWRGNRENEGLKRSAPTLKTFLPFLKKVPILQCVREEEKEHVVKVTARKGGETTDECTCQKRRHASRKPFRRKALL